MFDILCFLLSFCIVIFVGIPAGLAILVVADEELVKLMHTEFGQFMCEIGDYVCRKLS